MTFLWREQPGLLGPTAVGTCGAELEGDERSKPSFWGVTVPGTRGVGSVCDGRNMLFASQEEVRARAGATRARERAVRFPCLFWGGAL